MQSHVQPETGSVNRCPSLRCGGLGCGWLGCDWLGCGWTRCGWLIGLLWVAGGATCVPRPTAQLPLSPAAFVAPPTFEEVAANLQRTSTNVQSLHSTSASVSTPGLPALRATLSLERPQRFRLQARLFGPEVDLGSNDQQLWFWANNDPQQAVYQVRHEQLAAAGRTQAFPIDPTWLIQAFGLVELRPEDQHEGPFPRADGKLEIRSHIQHPNGKVMQTIVVDATYGWIDEQVIWDAQGRQLAHIRASAFRYYEEGDVSLPHRIEIELDSAQLTIELEVSEYWINRLPGDGQQLWQMPAFEGYRRIDLAAISQAGRRLAAATARGSMPAYQSTDRFSYRPRMRGYSR